MGIEFLRRASSITGKRSSTKLVVLNIDGELYNLFLSLKLTIYCLILLIVIYFKISIPVYFLVYMNSV